MARTTRTESILLAAARWLALAAVALSPWMFGSADGWAYLFVIQLAGMGTAAWLLALTVSRSPRFLAIPLLVLLAALAAAMALQVAPLPPGLVRTLQPLPSGWFQSAHETLAQLDLGRLPGTDAHTLPSPTLSCAPVATVRSLYLFLSYAGVFATLVHTVRTWSQLRAAASVLVVSGFLLAVYGAIQRFAHAPAIYWFHTPRYGGEFFGPFSNRNHFAAHMNLLFGLALGVFLSSHPFEGGDEQENWRDRLAWLSSRRASGIALSGFAVVAIGAAACLSLSRGAILSLAAALVALGAIVSFRRDATRQARVGLAAVGALLIAAVVWLASDAVTARLGTLAEVVARPMEDYRAIVTLDTVAMFGACLPFGCGFGAFRHVYPLFQTPSLKFRWLHAHNDWAQMLAEGGLTGAFLFLLLCAAFLVYVMRRLPATTRRSRLFVAGTAIGIGALAIHSFVDYGLHKPANALLLAALAGLTVCAAHQRQRETVPDFLRPQPAGPDGTTPAGLRTAAVRATALALTAGLTVLHAAEWRELRAELAFSRFLFLREAAENAPTPAALRQTVAAACTEADLVISLSGGTPDAMSEITAALLRWGAERRLERTFRERLGEVAARSAIRAVEAAPTDYLAWLWLARTLSGLSLWDEAELALERARALVLHPEEIRLFIAPRHKPAPGGR